MKIVCAYSGGLDTSCMIPWLREHYDAEIITYTGDLGQGMDLEAVRAKALATGATAAVVDDLRDRFVQEFVWPALRAGAAEGSYPLHTALGPTLGPTPCGSGRRVRRGRHRTWLHRQGQRPSSSKSPRKLGPHLRWWPFVSGS